MRKETRKSWWFRLRREKKPSVIWHLRREKVFLFAWTFFSFLCIPLDIEVVCSLELVDQDLTGIWISGRVSLTNVKVEKIAENCSILLKSSCVREKIGTSLARKADLWWEKLGEGLVEHNRSFDFEPMNLESSPRTLLGLSFGFFHLFSLPQNSCESSSETRKNEKKKKSWTKPTFHFTFAINLKIDRRRHLV